MPHLSAVPSIVEKWYNPVMAIGFHFFLTRIGDGDIDDKNKIDVVFANDEKEAERFLVSKRIAQIFTYRYAGFIDNFAIDQKIGNQIEEKKCAFHTAAAVRYAKQEYNELLSPLEKTTLEKTAKKIEEIFFA